MAPSLLNVVLASGLGCIERYKWLAVLTRTHVFFLVTVCFLLDPAENSRVHGIVCCLVGQWWKSAEHVAVSISVF